MLELIDAIFYVAVFILLYVSSFWLILSMENKSKLRKKIMPKILPSLSVIVPAFNEEKTIEKSVKSLINQNYPKLRIIIVDDGSTDNTARTCKKLLKRYKNVKYMRQKNQGKARALNNALKRVNTEVVGFLDADTYLDKGALKSIVAHFQNGYDAVTVAVKPTRSKTPAEKLQRIEYMLASFMRKLMTLVDALYVTPAFALYKTSVIKKLGGFDENNLTEDMEIGLRLQANGFRIENHLNKGVQTDTPKTFKELFRQRVRWYRGFIQNTRKYSNILFNNRFIALGWFILPFQYLLLLVTTPIIFFGIYNSVYTSLRSMLNLSITNFDLNYALAKTSFFITPHAIFFILLLLASLTIFKISEKYLSEHVGKLDYVFYIIAYPFINIALWMAAVVYEIIGVEEKW